MGPVRGFKKKRKPEKKHDKNGSAAASGSPEGDGPVAVSYTHLTLPTILLV